MSNTSKKILFIGVLAEQSGWGEASRNYLRALNKTGYDIVARIVKPNPNNPDFEFDDEIKSLLVKPSYGAEICIQHVLPHMMRPNGNFKKSIGIFVTETQNWHYSGWSNYLNLMDELWVPNSDMLYQAFDNGIRVKTELVPHAFDLTKYQRTDYPKLDLGADESNFKFYFIGENIRRKRLGGLIQAYHLAFKRNDPVSLVIKTNGSLENVERLSNEIKTGLKLYPQNNSYQREFIIVDRLTDEQMLGLHLSCDCFVNPSYGEAWCIPAFDAMAFGNIVISNNNGGPTDFLGCYYNSELIDGQNVPVIGAMDTFNFLNTGFETWSSIDIIELSKVMRDVYESKKDNKSKNQKDGLKTANEYSIEKIGQTMKGLLECS